MTGDSGFPLTPLQRRHLFARLLSRWVVEAVSLGYDVELCEVGVLEQRVGLPADEHGKPSTTERSRFIDRVHKPGSRHYDRCAADPVVWKLSRHGGMERVTESTDPAWVELGELWESYHPLCHNGRRYGDANHLSLRGEDGMA